MIAEYLNICKTVVLQILKEDLGNRNLCARFAPHSLTPEQREDRVTSCQVIIVMANADKNFLNKIIAGEETWCFACGKTPGACVCGADVARQHPHHTHDLCSGSQDHHPSKNSVQKTICCKSTSSTPDDGHMYPKHVKL